MPIVAIIADFEDDSVAASLGDLENILPTECSVRRHSVPARGHFCLALDIGATTTGVSVACDLRLREPQRFHQADRVAVFYWLKRGEFQLAFRIRDQLGQIFETPLRTISTRNRWVRVAADLDPAKLRRISGDGPLVWPIEVHGCRVATGQVGRQSLFLDDLQVEHRVRCREMIHGEFVFDQPTRVYEPGSTIGAQINLENRSREEALRISVELSWTRPDGSVLQTQRATVTLPASGRDFRSRQPVDFSQRVTQPGLYHLIARARASGWSTSNVFRTSVAVTPNNRQLSRGRSTFFGVRTDLLREPVTDQGLEIAIARDIGVQLLAIDTPWRLIEPAADRFDFTPVDQIVNVLVRKDIDIAPLIILTDPPAWLPTGPERLVRLANVFEQLARRYGPKVLRYQPEADVLPESDGDLAAALQELQDRLRQVHPHIRVLSPPLPIDSDAAARCAAELTAAHADLEWCFHTGGGSSAAVKAFGEFRQRFGSKWRGSYRWLHEAQPLSGPTRFVDAEAVLRHYVHGALAGVAGITWYDLRDNDNDLARPEALRGLVRRDFSPKASQLGYGSAAGMLTGLTCSGPVFGTPTEYESALFIGSDRQVAVVLPKPNRIPNAVLAPFWRVPGEIDIRDFERRPVGALSSATGPLVPALPRPFFITLKLESAQPEPQIALAKPWLRVPAIAFCGKGEPLTVDVQPASDVSRGSLRLVLPPDAPFTATPTRRSFQVEADQTATAVFQLSHKLDEPFERSGLTLKVRLDGHTTEVPIEVRPIAEVRRRSSSSSALTGSEYRLAELSPAAGQRASATAVIHAAYTSRQLHVAVVLSDDRFVPNRAGVDQAESGDDLLFGVAVEGGEAHFEVRVDMSARPPTLEPAFGTASANGLANWSCNLVAGNTQDQRVYLLTIPARALGVARLRAPTRLLLAARYVDDDADGLPAVPLTWGQGLDGRRSAGGFHWIRLAKPTGGP